MEFIIKFLLAWGLISTPNDLDHIDQNKANTIQNYVRIILNLDPASATYDEDVKHYQIVINDELNGNGNGHH